MFALAARNGVRLPYRSVEALRPRRFTKLQDFLDIYYHGMSVLKVEQDYYDLAIAYLKRAAADSVRYVECFRSRGHTSRGIAFRRWSMGSPARSRTRSAGSVSART
jgi:adenosine deaminase